MDAQNSITPLDITNFLEQGALLRYQSQTPGIAREQQVWELVWGPFDEKSEVTGAEAAFFIQNFYGPVGSAFRVGKRHESLSTAQLQAAIKAWLSEQKVTDLKGLGDRSNWQEPAFDDFQSAFVEIQKRIRAGEIVKAVPVIFARKAGVPHLSERAQMIMQLTEAPSSLFIHGFWNLQRGILGATPETLFVTEGEFLKTMALAGTLPKAATAGRKPLLEDEKELKEHDLVVQDIENVFKVYGHVEKQGPFVIELPSLWHLKTNMQVKAQIKTQDFARLVDSLHPTPALGVSPRAAGFSWMQELRGQEGRASYGAPFGFLNAKKKICLVAIRNLQWNEKETMIGSGCGIVAESQLEQEWEELKQKRQSVRKILGLENA